MNARSRRCVALAVVGLALLLSGCCVLDNWLPSMLLDHYKFSVDAEPKAFADWGAAHELVSTETSDHVKIAGWFVPAKLEAGQATATIIVLHTLGRTRQDMLDFALPLWRRGFHLLLIDLRGHGESGGKHFTYGAHEWRDVAAAIDYLKTRDDGSGERVALLGASAGGAVAIAAAARDDRVRALVTVEAFADLEEMAQREASWLPASWVRRGLRKAEAIADFNASDASPVRSITKVKCPALIVHGDSDKRIPYDDARRLFAAATCEKELYTLRGGDHSNMFSVGGDPLYARMDRFLRRACGLAEPL